MTSHGQRQYAPHELRRIIAALPRRAVGVSAQLLYYATALAVLYRIYAGDFSALPWLPTSPILIRLIEAVGGNIVSTVFDRVVHDQELSPEDILARLELAIEGLSDEVRATLTGNEQVLTLIYQLFQRLQSGFDLPANATPDEIAALADLAQPAAIALPRTPHLLTRIGHEHELNQTLNWLPEIERTGKGRVLFLMGGLGSGRSAFAAEVRVAAAARGFRAPTLRFAPTEAQTAREAEEYWRLGRRPTSIRAVFEDFPATTKEAINRQWADLMIQLNEAGAYAGPSGPANDIDALGYYIRSAARAGSLVITLDNLDWAPAYWIDLLLRPAREIVQDLPVLLLISLESPAPLAELTSPRHTETTRLAQKLAGEGTAEAIYFGPVNYDDIARRIGPAASDLASRLYYLSGGDPKVAEIIWLEWIAQGVVVADDAGRWQLTQPAVPNEPDSRWWVFGDAADHARASLLETLEDRPEEPPYALEDVEAILSCAALEGETFTVRAVAQTLGWDADELSDFLDEYLMPCDDPDDPGNSYPGILEEVGFTPVDQFRQLYQYRFARPYLHHVWAKYPAAPERVAEWRRKLPLVLEGLYYPNGYRIAGKLTRLFAAADMTDKADEYRRFGHAQQSLDQLRSYVQTLLRGMPEDKYEAYRLFDVGFSTVEKLLSQRQDLWKESYRLAHRLAALAFCYADWEYEARAYYCLAYSLLNAGLPKRGLFWIHRCETIYKLNDLMPALQLNFTDVDLPALYGMSASQRQEQAKLGIVDNLKGNLLQVQGNLTAARLYLTRALAIDERILSPEHPDIAHILNNLGIVLSKQGDMAAAGIHLERALAIKEHNYGLEHPEIAGVLTNLGILRMTQGDLPAARPYFERALAIRERINDPDETHLATCLNNLGALLRVQGDLTAARPVLERALAIQERILGEHPDTAMTLMNLGLLLLELGDLSAARLYLDGSLAIREKTLGPDHHLTRQVRNNLAAIEAAGEQ